MPKNTTLLQITDLHILPNEGDELLGADTYSALRLVLENALAEHQPDAIVATGDLTQDGSDTSYERLRGVLLQTGLPIYALPGNHDSVAGMERCLAGGPIRVDPTHEIGGWRLVLLNSQVEGHSHGALDPGQLSLLKGSAANTDGPVIACLHHGPDAPCADPGCHLHDDEALRQLVRDNKNVRVLLGGHTHLAHESRIGGAAFYSTPATCVQAKHLVPRGETPAADFLSGHDFNPRKHGYRILSLSPDGQFATDVHFVESAV